MPVPLKSKFRLAGTLTVALIAAITDYSSPHCAAACPKMGSAMAEKRS